jgi:glyoxylase-like metal-dependent hydrolase (beta-lactamase superfamily II)
MIIKCLSTGMFDSNSYVVGENGEAVIIDAGVDSEEILRTAKENNLEVKAIILTHSHIDHICSVDDLRKETGAKVYAHEEEKEWLADSNLNLSSFVGESVEYRAADCLLKDGDKLKAGGLLLEVIHTPGHTPGSISIKIGDNIFTGDTLFKEGIGRTDLPMGSYENIIVSIKKRLLKLGSGFRVFPGHGMSTTIGYERKNNPFIGRIDSN